MTGRIEPAIAYLHPETGGDVTLSEAEGRALLERYPELDFQYRKWRGQFGGRGRMIVIDEEIIAAIVRGEVTP